MTNEQIAVKIQAGEKDFCADLWDNVKNYVRQAAGKYYAKYRSRCDSAGVSFDDLYQDGYFAMLDAVQAYKPEEYRFISYLRYPLKNHFNALVGFRGKKDPLNDSESLDLPIGEEGDESRLDFLEDPEAYAPFEAAEGRIFNSQLHDVLESCLDRIPENQSQVVRGYYYEEKPLKELWSSPERARQLRQNGLRSLRRVGKRQLEPFAEEILSYRYYAGTLSSFRRFEGSIEEQILERKERKIWTNLQKIEPF